MTTIETVDDLAIEIYSAEIFRRCDSDDSVRVSGLPKQARRAVDFCLAGGTAEEARSHITSSHPAAEVVLLALEELGSVTDIHRWLLNPWPNAFAHTYLYLRQIHPELEDPTPAARILRFAYDGAQPGHAKTMFLPHYGGWLDLHTVMIRRAVA